MTDGAKGVVAMVAACVIWGFSSLYFALVAHLPSSEVLAHRILWSFVVFGLLLILQGRFGAVIATLRAGGLWMTLAPSLLISVNWFLFIYAVSIGHATEASLGYYLFPLIAVFLGAAFLGERPARLQWIAIALATLALVVLTLGLGAAPWMAVTLAASFAAYGLFKRRVKVGPVVSVTAEFTLLAPVALLGLIALGGGQAWGGPPAEMALLSLSGPLTAIPMILFSYAARRVAYGTLGVLQYLNPTLQFGCAVMILGEPFGAVQLVAFAMIWTAVVLYSAVALRAARRAARS